MERRDVVLKELEKRLSINFKNINYLDIALTHSSYANQNKKVEYNERMEFLGDSVLQLVISEYLFLNYKDKSEGELTKLRALIVCENSLYTVSQKWNLGECLVMSKGEELTGGRTRVSILADAVEAIIASIYIDQGFEVAKKFIINNFTDIITKATSNEIILDYKTRLQEILQKNGEINIEYKMIKFEGPPHRRIFHMEVLINGKTKGKGEGFSKKEAEQNAAKESLKVLERINE